jgi:oxepin-CoA hydrolase/3-oxo-5,6-dehydrosuberyl-CoA semialdehyde dehydrogenase
MITLSSYVLGTWHEARDPKQTLHDPATEEPLAECGTGGIDFGAVLRHARESGGPALRALGFRRRGELLAGLSKAIHAERDLLLDLSVKNAGATRSDAKFDVDGAIGTLAAYARWGGELDERGFLADGEGVQLGRTARFWGQHVLVPRRGAALHVNAFNFPAWNMGEKMACALLAGMPVIEKPGTPTALVAWGVARAVVASGLLPEGAFQFLCGGVGDLLDHVGPQDVLAFTGSSQTAAKLRTHPAIVRHSVHVNVEADSVNAAVLAPDVDRESPTYGLFLANVELDVVQKAGQKCTAVRRVLVPRERTDEVTADLVAAFERVSVGDPASRETRMGPLATARQLADVRRGIERLAGAARIACGGPDPVHEKGWYVAPTLLVAEDSEADVLHELEVFGPVASVLPYSGEPEEAARLANRGGGGLVASVYSDERAWIERAVLELGPWHGRIWIGSERLGDQALAPGAVLPATIHGGPGRAGGGEELGGLRGLAPYLQRTALQGFQGLLQQAFGPAKR